MSMGFSLVVMKMNVFWNLIELVVAQHCKYAKCIELYFSMVKVTNYMLSVFYHMCKRGLSIEVNIIAGSKGMIKSARLRILLRTARPEQRDCQQ